MTNGQLSARVPIHGMQRARSIAIVVAVSFGTMFAGAAEVTIPAAKAQCGSLARVSFQVVAPGPVAQVQFALAVSGAGFVGVHQTPATPKWLIRRVDDAERTTIVMRGGPVEGPQTLGQIVLRVPPNSSEGVSVTLSEIRVFGDGFAQTAPDITASVTVDCDSPPLVFEHLSGSRGGPGARDGTAGRALLKDTRSIVTDAEGNIFVADSGNHAIRRIDARGEVITLAGRLGVAGHADGTGPAALFQTPRGIALAPDGSLVVADTGTQTIRRVSPSGDVTTIAGKPGEQGGVDGGGSAARFCFPSAVAVASDGSIVVADTGYLHEPIYGLDWCGHTIRKIDTGGQVSTFAGKSGSVGISNGSGAEARFSYPSGVAIAGDGSIWVADAGFMYGRSFTGRTIRRIAPDGAVSTIAGRPDGPYLGGSVDGTGSAAHFGLPTQIALEAAGTILVADSGSIRRVTAAGVVTTVAGAPGASRGVAIGSGGELFASDANGAVWRLAPPASPVLVAGSRSDPGFSLLPDQDAQFHGPAGVGVDGEGSVLMADFDRIVKVPREGRPTVVIGRDDFPVFEQFVDVAVDRHGTLWIADIDCSCIWKVPPGWRADPAGSILKIGGWNGWFGWADGPAAEAMFFWPRGIVVAPDDSVWVADTNNHVLRRITQDGVVSTVAGRHGENATRDGTLESAAFNHPAGIAFGPDGEVWVTETYGQTVRLVTTEGQVLTIAGGPGVEGDADGAGVEARFKWPVDVAVDSRGRAWVAEEYGAMLRIVERDGTVTTAAGGPVGFARFDASSFLGVDGGPGSETRWIRPTGLAFDADGNLFVVDQGAYSLKVGRPCHEGARCGEARGRAIRR